MRLKYGHAKGKFILTVFLISLLLSSFLACGKNEVLPPRDIEVEEITGGASAGRNGEEWDVYAGLNLVSGDEVSVSDDSDLILLFDEDRHLYADRGACFSLLSEGKPGKGVTAVILQEGRVLAGIDGKPKAKDVFWVVTPNICISATKKETVFSVEITEEGGDKTTSVSIINGSAQLRTVLGGAERSQELTAGESGTYAGSAPEFADIVGKGSEKDQSGPETQDNYKDAGADPKNRENTGETDALYQDSDPYVDGIVAAYQFLDGINQKTDLAATRRAYKTKLEAWLALVDIEFTAGDQVLGGSSDHIRVTEPDVLCFGERGFYLGDTEEEMWRFLGFHLDPLIADEGVSVKGEDGDTLDVSTRGFIYSKGEKKAQVKIGDGVISEISMDME